LDVAYDARGGGEIDYHIHGAQLFRGEGRAGGILRGSHYLYFVPAVARYFRHQRSCFSAAEKENIHEVKSPFNRKKR
jgi:hypothetical protein